MSPKYLFQLILLAALWGASFLFMRISVEALPPLVVAFARAGIAAVFLIVLVFIKRQFRYIISHWRPLAVVGLTNTALPFSLFSFATIYVEAGYASILNATAPMFTAITAFFWLGIRLPKSGLIGLFIGFLGVFFLVMNKLGEVSNVPLIAILSGLFAASQYGIAANVTKKYLQGVPSLAVAGGSILFAALIILPFILGQFPSKPIGQVTFGSLIFLGIGCTALPFLLYFNLLNQIGINQTISVTYLIPVFGIGWGMIFLNETVSWPMLFGALLVLFGVSLTTGVMKFRLSKSSSTPDK